MPQQRRRSLSYLQAIFHGRESLPVSASSSTLSSAAGSPTAHVPPSTLAVPYIRVTSAEDSARAPSPDDRLHLENGGGVGRDSSSSLPSSVPSSVIGDVDASRSASMEAPSGAGAAHTHTSTRKRLTVSSEVAESMPADSEDDDTRSYSSAVDPQEHRGQHTTTTTTRATADTPTERTRELLLGSSPLHTVSSSPMANSSLASPLPSSDAYGSDGAAGAHGEGAASASGTPLAPPGSRPPPSTPTIFPYHPLNTAAQDKGYMGNLTEPQARALDSLRARVQREGPNITPHLCSPAESLDHFLLRFLRARQFHEQKSYDMLRTDILWREEQSILALRELSMEEVVKCDLALIHHHLPLWQRGFDRQGRPVIYKQFGSCEISTLKQHTAIENLIRYHTWCTERQLLALGRQSTRTGLNIETFLFVVDAKGWSLRLATQDAFKYLRGLADLDSAHYPERLGAIAIINAPIALDFAWRVVQVWLDPRTKAKVHIMRKGSEEALQKLIEPQFIPSDYGGEGPPLGQSGVEEK